MPAYGILLGFADMSWVTKHLHYGVIRKRDGLMLGWITRSAKHGGLTFAKKRSRRATADEQAEIDAFIAAKERRKRKGGKRK